jgi:hypothetical protein
VHIFRGIRAIIEHAGEVKQIADLHKTLIRSIALDTEQSTVRLVPLAGDVAFFPPGTRLKEQIKELPQPVDIRFSFNLDTKTPLTCNSHQYTCATAPDLA